MTLRLPWGALALVGIAAVPALAQTEVLVVTGDTFPGIGTVDEVFDLAIDDSGDWLAIVHGDQQLLSEMALIHNGTLIAASGDPLAGSSLGFQRAARLDMDGAGGYAWVAAPPGQVFASGLGVYLGLTPVAEKGDAVTAPGVTAGTTWIGFWDVELEPSGSLVVNGYANDPTIIGIHDSMLVRYTPAVGGGWSQTLLAARGQTLPGSTGTIHDFAEYDNGLDVDSAGTVLSYVSFQGAQDALYLGAAPLAQAGGQSPVFGRTYGSFYRMPVALNDQGDTLFGAYLSGDSATREILTWNGIELAQQGDPLDAIAPHVLTSLGLQSSFRAPVRLTDQGQAVWYGEWDETDPTRDAGLFLDHDLWIAEGETVIDGSVIVDLEGFTGPIPIADHPVFTVTGDGQQVGLRATLADGRTGAFRLRPAGGVEVLTGCTPSAGTLSAAGPPVLGGTMTFIVGAAPVDGVSGFVFLSDQPAPGTPPCGVPLPGLGELLIDLTPPNPLLVQPGFWPAIGGQTFTLLPSVPVDPQLFGTTLYVQGLWLDLAGVSPAEPIRLTNGLALSIGTP